MSKKLATIITNVPTEFHEENFMIREMNKDAIREVFAELEFKTLGKRLLGDDETAVAIDTITEAKPEKKKSTPQMDLFGNIIDEPETMVVVENIVAAGAPKIGRASCRERV